MQVSCHTLAKSMEHNAMRSILWSTMLSAAFMEHNAMRSNYGAQSYA